jgi:hypothetical protein
MNISLDNSGLRIQLEPLERFLSVHLNQQIQVSFEHLQSARLERPESTWRELRSPGSYIPGWIKAGTYYTERGREFWYSLKDQPCLCLDFTEGYYKRIVIGSNQAEQWHAQIQSVTEPSA